MSIRDKEILFLLKEGNSYHEIAAIYGLHWGTVKNFAIKNKVNYKSIVVKKRNDEIVCLLKSGTLVKDIAKQFNLTKESICGIVKKHVGVLPSELLKAYENSRTEKPCKWCKISKPIDKFRERVWKGVRGRMGVCEECEVKDRKDRYWSNPEEGRRKSRESMRKLWKEKPEERKKKVKDYRDKNREKVRQWEREWYAKNIDGQKKHKIRAQKWHEKNRDELTDVYVGSRIIQGTTLSRNELPPALIKLKRLQIICKRSLKLQLK